MTGLLARTLIEACERYADRSALVGGDTSLTYSELAMQAAAVRDRLVAAGCGRDEPVHVLVSNEPRDFPAILGIWLAEAVAVPEHRVSPPDVTAAQRSRTKARLVVDTAAPELVRVLAESRPPSRPLLQGAALVVFTSGSTGTPKGVVIGHEAFDGKMRQIDSLLHFAEGETSLLALNITFSFGMWLSLLTLRTGGRLVMRQRFEPADVVRTLADEKVTRVGVVPTMLRMLFADDIHRPAVDRLDAQHTLRQILIGGEALGLSLGREIRERFSATDLVDIYGLTETATCDFFGFPEDFAAYPGAIGRPSPNVAFRVVEPDPEGIGELQIRSPYLMNGYLDDNELTAAAYDDGWLRTGDLGREVGPGVVALMGRRKELISRGGNKIAPAEIEHAFGSHPGIAAAMATGVPDELLGERVHALLVPRAGVHLDLDTVLAHAAERLDRFKRPDAYYVADALPLGRTGKADRGVFRSQILSGIVQPARVEERSSMKESNDG